MPRHGVVVCRLGTEDGEVKRIRASQRVVCFRLRRLCPGATMTYFYVAGGRRSREVVSERWRTGGTYGVIIVLQAQGRSAGTSPRTERTARQSQSTMRLSWSKSMSQSAIHFAPPLVPGRARVPRLRKLFFICA